MRITKLLPTIVILLSSLNIAAQNRTYSPKPPPPPPAKIEGTGTVTTDWVKEASGKYSTAKGGYKVAFPSRPATTYVPMETAFGKATLTFDIAGTALAAFYVCYFDFPTDITEKFALDVRYDQMRDTQAKQMSGVVKKDEEFYFGSYYGREVVIEGGGKTYTGRVLAIGARIFLMAVETSGTLSTQSEKTRNSHSKKIKGFFDSFEVTNVHQATLKPVELPADFGMEYKDELLTSEFLKIEWQVPTGWAVSSEEYGSMLFETGKEAMRSKRPELADYLTDQNSRILTFVSDTDPEIKAPEAMIYVMTERADFPTFLARAAADSYLKLFIDQNETVVEPVEVTKIGGIEFASFTLFDSSTEYYSKMYYANRFGTALVFKLLYRDPVDLETMTGSLNTLRSTQE